MAVKGNLIDTSQVPTPAYICETEKLIANCKILEHVRKEAGCRIVLALKAFAMRALFASTSPYLDGVSASSLNEAHLGFEEFGKEVHYHAPAIAEKNIDAILKYSDHLILNSFEQVNRYQKRIEQSDKKNKIGLRINPQVSVVTTKMYDPSSADSRFGIRAEDFDITKLAGVTGLHFHALCENGVEELEKVLVVVEKKFGSVLHKMEWVNFGGGHLITSADYDIDRLIPLIKKFKKKYGVEVILEPGEAVALNAGVLVGEVIDILHKKIDIAILDVSASTHMPDILEMPYRPEVRGAGRPGALPNTYRLAGNSCLAGDIIGDYSFAKPLNRGDKLIFENMLIYTMVKNNQFNGIELPEIGVWENGLYRTLKTFGYDDYKNRL